MGTIEKTPQNANSAKITFEEFIELVKQMRHNQRRYERLCKPQIWETCKELEKKVDEIILKMTDQQQKLF